MLLVNVTVPVGGLPPLLVLTTALRTTLEPDLTEERLLVTAVCVDTWVIVIERELLVDVAA